MFGKKDSSNYQILDTIGNAVVIHDRNGCILHVNRSALAFFGFGSQNEAKKVNLVQSFSANQVSADEFSRQMKLVQEKGRTTFDWLMHSDGKKNIPVSVQTSSSPGPQKQELYISQFWDISSIKGVMEVLHESEAKFRFIAENSMEVIWMMDKEFRFTYISNSDEQLRGFTPDELIGKSFFNYLSREGAEYIQAANQKRRDQESQGIKTGIARYQLEQICKDGRYIWTEITAAPYRDTEGNLVGYFGVTRDLSEQKYFEQQTLAETTKLEAVLDQLNLAQEKLNYLENYDGLTGLLNRRSFQELTEKEIKRSVRYHHSLVMLLINIDNFKNININYGHAIGDEVLAKLAQTIQDSARQHDEAARLQSDEFALLLPETNISGGLTIAERIRITVEKQIMVLSNKAEVSITCSFGLVGFDPADANFLHLYREADEALYKAKQMGKNRVEVGGFIK
jgi:diguanylate cyclase (GGDEF)-like protein/PAS domain S-box-containing protein